MPCVPYIETEENNIEPCYLSYYFPFFCNRFVADVQEVSWPYKAMVCAWGWTAEACISPLVTLLFPARTSWLWSLRRQILQALCFAETAFAHSQMKTSDPFTPVSRGIHASGRNVQRREATGFASRNLLSARMEAVFTTTVTTNMCGSWRPMTCPFVRGDISALRFCAQVIVMADSTVQNEKPGAQLGTLTAGSVHWICS